MLLVTAALARIVAYAAVPCWPDIGAAQLRARDPCEMTSHRAPWGGGSRFVVMLRSWSMPVTRVFDCCAPTLDCTMYGVLCYDVYPDVVILRFGFCSVAGVSNNSRSRLESTTARSHSTGTDVMIGVWVGRYWSCDTYGFHEHRLWNASWFRNDLAFRERAG